MILIGRYMCYVEHPFVGYRLSPAYSHLLPTCAGRPAQYALSALYLMDGIEGYDEARQELFQFDEPASEKHYPGQH